MSEIVIEQVGVEMLRRSVKKLIDDESQRLADYPPEVAAEGIRQMVEAYAIGVLIGAVSGRHQPFDLWKGAASVEELKSILGL